jgi:hypothetical protein
MARWRPARGIDDGNLRVTLGHLVPPPCRIATPDQFFSWIRSPRVLVRGERGEINDMAVRALHGAVTPVTLELSRRDTGHDGNLEGLYHEGITLGDEWVYRNPFVPARLTDDEIAVATCLSRMGAYVEGGPALCSLAEAAWDHELGLRMAEVASSGRPVRVEPPAFGPAAGSDASGRSAWHRAAAGGS